MILEHKIEIINQKLKSEYKHSAQEPNVFNTEIRTVAGELSEPLDGLIETILSQQSPIASTQRMANALFITYPKWDDALTAVKSFLFAVNIFLSAVIRFLNEVAIFFKAVINILDAVNIILNTVTITLNEVESYCFEVLIFLNEV